ncbi:MAG TPA: hypothetical protein QGI07_03185 [Dehalococcoidia bacterium]|jgi:hypothetical protein|nr:hypothetical protein [Chloroflexota bacterium]MDP5876214.1 hypothetical protein [Dehalococcoidia bacterium]MDP6273510.1 hypothetical protein [Dehalococcoidia bacterium]MDP7160828.1 hypothetical protein [Dehalococcoidia bacterium]MDP7212686.1 hypothetical protein [Dehalococcoidia bacterium]|tara:strand:- start:3713 stop:3979 length:267 start_codon:yes stop_codon:yes gene_type:complete
MRMYWKEHPKGLDLALLTDQGEEVNLGGVRSLKRGIQAIAATRGYDPGRAVKGLGSLDEGKEFVLQFQPWREFVREDLVVEDEVVKAK